MSKAAQQDSGGGGGGGGGGGEQPPSLNDDDFNFLLRVGADHQKEQDIRESTRAMEQEKNSLELQNTNKPKQP